MLNTVFNRSSDLPEPQAPPIPCELSVSTVWTKQGPGRACKGVLLFQDNFDTLIDDWTVERKIPLGPDYPFNIYDNSVANDLVRGRTRRNIEVKDGRLQILPSMLSRTQNEGDIIDLSVGCTGQIDTAECYRVQSGYQIIPPIITGKVTTKKHFSFKYGRIDVGAKMSEGDWLVPEIQLEPRDHVYGTENYASGLLRIASMKGNAVYPGYLYGGPILYSKQPFRAAHLFSKTGYWSRDIHNFSMVWTPDNITLYVDGIHYGTVNPFEGTNRDAVNFTRYIYNFPTEGFYHDAIKFGIPAAAQWRKGTAMAPFDELFYISIGLKVGGINVFLEGDTKPWSDSSPKALFHFWEARRQWLPTWKENLEIDYVRVYAL